MGAANAAGLDALDEIAGKLRRDGIELVYARLTGPMRERLGPGHPTVRAAVAAVAGSPRPGEPQPPREPG